MVEAGRTDLAKEMVTGINKPAYKRDVADNKIMDTQVAIDRIKKKKQANRTPAEKKKLTKLNQDLVKYRADKKKASQKVKDQKKK